jgi:chromosome segregation ATPase
MFSEITQLAEKVQEAEKQLPASRDELLKLLAFAKERREADVNKLSSKIHKLSTKNETLARENASLQERVTQLEARVKEHVDQRFKNYIASQQSSSWFRDFERNMMNDPK